MGARWHALLAALPFDDALRTRPLIHSLTYSLTYLYTHYTHSLHSFLDDDEMGKLVSLVFLFCCGAGGGLVCVVEFSGFLLLLHLSSSLHCLWSVISVFVFVCVYIAMDGVCVYLVCLGLIACIILDCIYLCHFCIVAGSSLLFCLVLCCVFLSMGLLCDVSLDEVGKGRGGFFGSIVIRSFRVFTVCICVSYYIYPVYIATNFNRLISASIAPLPTHKDCYGKSVRALIGIFSRFARFSLLLREVGTSVFLCATFFFGVSLVFLTCPFFFFCSVLAWFGICLYRKLGEDGTSM